jgi:hypothetical protein
MRRTFPLAVLVAFGAFSAFAPGAFAADQTVAGTTAGTLSLSVGTPAAFGTTLSPGTTQTAVGTLLATSTNPSWNLAVRDNASTPGKMDALGGLTCTGSEANLTNALSVNVTGGGTSAGPVSISGVDQTVASAGGSNPDAPLAAATLTNNYSQTIGSGETLTAGCVYSLTATYTLS